MNVETNIDGPRMKEGKYGIIRARHVLVIEGFLGLTIVYLLRVNLNVAIVAMTKPLAPTGNFTVSCPIREDTYSSTTKRGTLEWSSSDQGLILGCFYWGYCITSFVGGTLAERIGGKLVFGIAILVTSLLTLLTQVASLYSKWALLALRVLEGTFEGMCWPSMHTLSGKWLPRSERSVLYSIINTGAEFGAAIGYPIAGALCDSSFLGGWPSAFYIFGCMGAIWFVSWRFLVYESPSEHPRISDDEAKFIINNLEVDSQKKTPFRMMPWFKILTSLPLWSVALTSFCTHWAFEFIFNDLSTFLQQVLHFPIQANGFLSSLPHICHVLVQWTGGFVADYIIYRKRWFGQTPTRKAINLFACVVTCLCFLGAILVECHTTWVVVFIVIGTGAQGLNTPSFNVALIDMAPEYAGTLMGLANGIGNLSSFIAPTVVGALTNKYHSIEEWHTAFYIAAGISLLGGVIFTVFGSSELQPWANAIGKKVDTEITVIEQNIRNQSEELSHSGKPKIEDSSKNVHNSKL